MMTTTYKEKIMNFDIANGYEAFINMFDEKDIDEMRSYIEREYGYDCSFYTKEDTIVDYVKEWLCENVRNMRYDGTEQLFNIVYKVF